MKTKMVIAVVVICAAPSLCYADVVTAVPGVTTYCMVGDAIEITGTFPQSLDVQVSTLRVDGETFSRSNYKASFEWTASTPGQHEANVDYTLGNGDRVRANHVPGNEFDIVVMGTSPIKSDGLPGVIVNDAPLTIQIDQALMPAAKVSFTVNNMSYQAKPSTDGAFMATLPIGSLQAGRYKITANLTDSGGGRFSANIQTIAVPPRLTINLPKAWTRDDANDRFTVTPDLVSGFVPDSVTFDISGQGMETAISAPNRPPYTCEMDLANLPTGAYKVSVIAKVNNNSFESDPVSFDFNNRFADIQRAQADYRAEQLRLAEAAAERTAEASRAASARKEQDRVEAEYSSLRSATMQAEENHALSLSVADFSRSDSEYSATITVTNDSSVTINIGELLPEIVFDDHSNAILGVDAHTSGARTVTLQGGDRTILKLQPHSQNSYNFYAELPQEYNPTRKAIKIRLPLSGDTFAIDN